MVDCIYRTNFYRNFLLKKDIHPVIRRYLETPLVDKQKIIKECEFVVLDFETTGLDLKNDDILSFGWILIQNKKIVLNKCAHHIVNVNKKLEKSNVVVHKITDDDMTVAKKLTEILPKLLQVIKGRVIVAHHSKIENNYLQKACKLLYGYKIPLLFVDTMEIQKKEQERRNIPIAASSLRLFNIRDKLNLPRYKAHNALEDAIATAEIFLAQISHMQRGFATKLKNVL
jgi:DNA polymerase III subunit epsilon